MANISKETYNQRTKIDRLFPQGIEAKEVWFQGNCIFKLSGGIQKIDISGLTATQMMKVGEYMICYHPNQRRFCRIKNGRQLGVEVIAETPSVYGGVNVIPLYKQEMLLFIDRGWKKIFLLKADKTVSFDISDEFCTIFGRYYNSLNVFPFIHNGYLCIGSFFDNVDYKHIHNYVLGFELDENYEPIREICTERYGIAESIVIDPNEEYAIPYNIMWDVIKYDEVTDTLWVNTPLRIKNDTATVNYGRVTNFKVDDFDIAYSLRLYQIGNPTAKKYTECHVMQAIGAYGLSDGYDYYHSTYKMPKLLTNFPAYEYAWYNDPSAKENYSFYTHAMWFGYSTKTNRYYGISLDDATECDYYWISPPMPYTVKGFCYSSDADNWTKIQDVGTKAEFEDAEFCSVAYINSDGIYVGAFGSSGSWGRIYYIDYKEE